MELIPKTGEAIERVSTIAGIKDVLDEYRLHSPIVNNAFNVVEFRDDFKDDDVYVLIAFYALQSLEATNKGFQDHLSKCGTPNLFLNQERK